MNSDIALQAICDRGIVAGLRGNFPPDIALAVSEVLMREGINCFELTLNSQQPIAAMQSLKAAYGDEAVVGMGTVLDVASAEAVLDAGADFILSPAFQPDVLQAVQARGRLMAPGVATASEAAAAWALGAPLLKLFPIGALGLDYFSALFAPLQHMRFMCNGAMHAENARAFIQAGAVACGMGGWLVGAGDWSKSRIRSRARLLVNAVESVL